VVPLGTLLLLALVLTGVYLRRRKGLKVERSTARRRARDDDRSTSYVHPEKFTLRVLRAATGNFAVENKLGEGGFGEVFKVLSLSVFRSRNKNHPLSFSELFYST
jgi:interleukin-1 receptor-associated kinase 1